MGSINISQEGIKQKLSLQKINVFEYVHDLILMNSKHKNEGERQIKEILLSSPLIVSWRFGRKGKCKRNSGEGGTCIPNKQ